MVDEHKQRNIVTFKNEVKKKKENGKDEA